MIDVKALLLIIILLLTITNPSYAGIDLCYGLELAFENNIDLKIAGLNLANSEMDLERARLSSQTYTRAEQLRTELDLARTMYTYTNVRYNIAVGIIIDYIQLTILRKNIEADELILEINELELEQVEKLYDKGMATRTEWIDARLMVEEQKLVLYRNNRRLNKLVDDLSTKLGVGETTEFKELEFKLTPLEIDIESIIKSAYGNNLDIKDKNIQYQLISLEIEKGELEGLPGLELEKLSNNKTIAMYELEKSEKKLEQDIKDKIWSLEEGLKIIEFREAENEIALDHYEKTKTSYEQGFSTERQYIQSKIGLLNSSRALFSAQTDYLLETIQLYHMIGEDEFIFHYINDVMFERGDLK